MVAVGGLLLEAGAGEAGAGALILLVAFALSNVALFLLPPRHVSSFRFDLGMGALDLALVGLGINLAGAGAGALPVSCLLMVLVVAIGSYRAHAIAGATVVGALHAWLVLRLGGSEGTAQQLVLQTLFLCAVGFYYGCLTEGVHFFRRHEEAETQERRELAALLDILTTVTSSLDLRQVTYGIVSKLSHIVPTTRCSLLYVDKDGKRGYVLASHEAPSVNMLEIDLAKYPEVRRAIERRETMVIQDLLHDPLMSEVRDEVRALEFQSMIVVPLTFAEEFLGTLCLRTARAWRGFSDSEIKLCTAAGRASANALKNAFLHRQVLEQATHNQRMREKLSRILNNSPELILTTDIDGRITEINRGAERLLGYTREEILEKPCPALIADERETDLVARVRAAGVLSNHTCTLRRKDGSTVEMEINLSVLKDDADHVEGTVWIGRDVTELKAAQLQLLQAEKLSTIGQVISGVAHELANPLSGVLGYSQLVLARHGNHPAAREVERIHESALRCQKIVKNLLSFARAHKPERRYLGINGILEKTLDLKHYQLQVNNVTVVREMDPHLPMTMLDFHQMEQVFLNLINNAQAAMSGRPGRLVVRTFLEGERIQVEIEDNGDGIDESVLSRIFDPFFTTKPPGEGTGLGLSVSYGIVKEHGGSIRAQSRKGEGTKFVIELPVWRGTAEQEPGQVRRPEAAPVERAEGGHILVVDDEPMVVDLLVEVLEEAGYRVDTAGNGAEACRKIRARAFDLVISDVRMPHMDGMDLYRNILSVRPEMKDRVIFATGDLIEEHTVRFLAEVHARTVPKPLDISQVIRTVHEALGSPVAV